MVKIKTGISIEEDLLMEAKHCAIDSKLTFSGFVKQALINEIKKSKKKKEEKVKPTKKQKIKEKKEESEDFDWEK